MVHYRSLKSVMVYIFLSLFAVSTFGQTRSFSKKQMIQDIDTLFSSIEKVHVNMYAVYPKQQLDKDIEKVKSELKPSGDIFYFYKEVTPLVVKLGDGHTNIVPPNPDPSDFINTLVFPLSVKITYPEREIYIQNDCTQMQNAIPFGAQIESINNRKPKDIVPIMLNYMSGEKDFFKTQKLNYFFNILFYTLYRDTIFDIKYVFNQKKYSKQVKGIPDQELNDKLSQENRFGFDNPYIFRTIPDKNIGIIEFNQFEDIDKFKVFLNSTFQVLQREHIGNLIIDLRKNGGGDTQLGDELFQYISPVPFAQISKSIVKVSDILKSQGLEIGEPNGIEIRNEELTELRENPLRYKGNVFLLISHLTFSAAADFSGTFKHFKMGTVIGEETGGMNVNFGDVISLRLPNTGLLYTISHRKWYQYGATDSDIHGTLPDYTVGADKALDFTTDMITKKLKQ